MSRNLIKSISGSPDNLRQLNPQSVSQRRQPTEILIHSTDRTRALPFLNNPRKILLLSIFLPMPFPKYETIALFYYFEQSVASAATVDGSI
ncbi:hypothetical protein TNCV_1219471 [Trichonephila clavipes]|nr:hypothetical protein TNCV_1219471 [Trichonephila clavipes]